MSEVRFENIVKIFGENRIVDNFNLKIKNGDFVSFLGPSGCGKTTCLRMLAGLEENSSGKIYLGDKLISDPQNGIFTPPEKRKIGMVFQSYAVWPHMTIFDNIAYPLKIAKVDKSEIEKRVNEIIDLVELSGMQKRLPQTLSGGQQQRVALARGLVMEPNVLLLDEPLSNLDAKLREKMRKDIRAIQQRLKLTCIYVTHDQVEAFSMSDQIVVMNKGQIIQAGSGDELKKNPVNDFVKEFIN